MIVIYTLLLIRFSIYMSYIQTKTSKVRTDSMLTNTKWNPNQWQQWRDEKPHCMDNIHPCTIFPWKKSSEKANSLTNKTILIQREYRSLTVYTPSQTGASHRHSANQNLSELIMGGNYHFRCRTPFGKATNPTTEHQCLRPQSERENTRIV
jgi:hypothetical protein